MGLFSVLPETTNGDGLVDQVSVNGVDNGMVSGIFDGSASAKIPRLGFLKNKIMENSYLNKKFTKGFL